LSFAKKFKASVTGCYE